MSNKSAALASFVESTPPGELPDVTKAITSILGPSTTLTSSLTPAFTKYNESQFTTVKLPGGSSSSSVLISSYNSLGSGRYYDVGQAVSWSFDHSTLQASDVRSHVVESEHEEVMKGLLKALGAHVEEHFPNATLGVYPTDDDGAVAIVVVANKYSPSNFWNGRWRSSYVYTPSTGALTGSINVDVHYYEDGNVRLLTNKPVSLGLSHGGASATEIVRALAGVEKRYQEDLNRAFATLSEGAFKALRRQLPITRQKIEWEKISGYRVGQDIGGGRAR
jgi:capping protein alpha